MPALIHWPAKLKPRRVVAPIHVVDWAPTLLSLTGAPMDGHSLKWDGENVRRLLTGEIDPSLDERILYWQGVRESTAALRQGNWKLIANLSSGSGELFNLAADPNEEQDLARKNPERMAALQRLLERERAQDNDALPRADPIP